MERLGVEIATIGNAVCLGSKGEREAKGPESGTVQGDVMGLLSMEGPPPNYRQ